MQRWTIRDDRREWPMSPLLAQTVTWVDDPEVASLHYEGPHGPASIAYHDGFTRTRVWGPQLPTGELADGPTLAQDPDAKLDRLKAGVSGRVGDAPLAVSMPPAGMRWVGFSMPVELGRSRYRLRFRAYPTVRVQLKRPDGAMAWRYAVPNGSSNRVADDVTPDEVCLALLLWSTPSVWAPPV